LHYWEGKITGSINLGNAKNKARLEFGIAYYEFVLEWYKKKFLDV
jgi:hypothetical protein